MTEMIGKTLIEQMQELSSAEDFFVFFFLPYDEKVLKVSRLHIMRRMGQYVRETDFSGLTDDEVFLATRLQLKRAYQDFVESTPLQEKVFKVFQDQAKQQRQKFVALDELSISAVAAE